VIKNLISERYRHIEPSSMMKTAAVAAGIRGSIGLTLGEPAYLRLRRSAKRGAVQKPVHGHCSSIIPLHRHLKHNISNSGEDPAPLNVDIPGEESLIWNEEHNL